MDIQRFSRLLAIFSGLLAVTACSPQPVTYSMITTDSAPVPSVDRNTQAKLAESAQAVNQSLEQLSAVQIATHPQVSMPPPMNPQKVGMDQLSSVDWTGPVEPLLKKVAAQSGYQLHVLGIEPPIPVIVSVTAKDQPLAYILRDVTFQVQDRAGIAVYPGKTKATRVIELRYYPSKS
ncbi:MAG TPA: type IVB secretion system lipoprotein DotD [Coxiellaceae bacterium]|nr:type IVB secretion system lipoprotein DotD [Coxiellaceae bacterium]